jgi:hypothetical protein
MSLTFLKASSGVGNWFSSTNRLQKRRGGQWIASQTIKKRPIKAASSSGSGTRSCAVDHISDRPGDLDVSDERPSSRSSCSSFADDELESKSTAPADAPFSKPPAAASSIRSADPGDESVETRKLKEKDTLNLWGLCKLASAARNDIPCTCDPHTIHIGSSNLIVSIEFSDNITWIARLPFQATSMPFDSATFVECMESTITTMEYVATRTKIPLPTIHGWDSSCDNLICRPYIFMETLSGENFSFHVDTLDDVTLQKVTVQWAQYIMQLANLRFPKIGSLRRNEDEDVIVSRSLTPHNCLPDQSSECIRGPFHSVADYLLSASAAKKVRNLRAGGPLAHGRHLRSTLIDGFLGYLMDYTYNDGPFVLHHPNFEVGHILIDPEKGNITGILDWDYTAVVPLQSHIFVPDELNYDFLPSCEIENEPGGIAGNGWKIDFSRKFRETFEDALVAAGANIGLEYRIDEILDRSLMFKMYERALHSWHDERYLPAIWAHVYGDGFSYDRVRTGMKYAEWGWKTAEKQGFKPTRTSVAFNSSADCSTSAQRKSLHFMATPSKTFSQFVTGSPRLSHSTVDVAVSEALAQM